MAYAKKEVKQTDR